MWFNMRDKFNVLSTEFKEHLKYCEEDRRTAADSRVDLRKHLDAYYTDTRESIRGIYKLLWRAVVGICVALGSLTVWLLSNNLTWRVPMH